MAPFRINITCADLCSGLQAIAFWVFIGDFDLMWWAFNLYLLLYPLYFIQKLLVSRKNSCHSFDEAVFFSSGGKHFS